MIKVFIAKWNQDHKNGQSCLFNVSWVSGMWFPLSIRIDYSPFEFWSQLTEANWERFNRELSKRSGGTMCPSTGSRLFGKGIVEVMVAYRNPNCTEENVVSTLKWVGEEFFKAS